MSDAETKTFDYAILLAVVSKAIDECRYDDAEGLAHEILVALEALGAIRVGR